MANKFTQKAQNALKRALTLAEELGHTYVGSEHLLLALSSERDSVATKLLTSRGATYDSLKSKLTQTIGIGSACRLSAEDMTPTLKRIIRFAADEALRAGIAGDAAEPLALQVSAKNVIIPTARGGV